MPIDTSAPRIALVAAAPRLGDFARNAAHLLDAARQAHAAGASWLISGEFSLCGAPAGDWWQRPDFHAAQAQALAQLAQELERDCPNMGLLLGHSCQLASGGVGNAISLLQGGQVRQQFVQNRPAHSLLGHAHYFEAAAHIQPHVLTLGGLRLGLLLGQDAADAACLQATLAAQPQALLCLEAQPYALGGHVAQAQKLQALAQSSGLPVLAANLLGGQDEWLFDGRLWAFNAQGQVLQHSPAFAAQPLLLNAADLQAPGQTLPAAEPAMSDAALAELWQALRCALRDYCDKNGFKRLALGLSGGIDSALVAVLAADALGAEAVHALMMPSPYTADISLHDAAELARRCGLRYDSLPIGPAFALLKNDMAPLFEGRAEDVTEENMQARIRGLMLMALSNKTGALVLVCSNKSEVAVGYCTLYGDMCGGYAPLKDVLKTQVFALARWRNRHTPAGCAAAPIPERIISRPPSAELRPDQEDLDSLPPYEVLDGILQAYMQQQASRADLLAAGYPAEAVEKVLRLLRGSEYKRAQAAPGPRVSARSFGPEWRFPVSSGFRA